MRRPRCRAGPADRGSATVWVIVATALLLLVGYGGMLLAAAQAARQRADAAADLAALAAAGALARGTDACAAAREVAGADGAALQGCTISGPNVDVTTSVRLPAALAAYHSGVARSRARAGPALGESAEPRG